MITRTKEIIETSSFGIKFQSMTKYKKKECQFNKDPTTCFMKECDDEARKVLEGMNNHQEDKNMDKVGNRRAILNDEILVRPVREAVRIMDSAESENCYLCEKSGENHNFIDTEARNEFANALSVAALKCSTGLNMHG